MMTPLDRLKAKAADLGLLLKDLYVLSSGNDPFACGRPAQVRDAEWFAAVWDQFGWQPGMHLRRGHYRVQARQNVPKPRGEIYLNDQRSWRMFSKASKYARHLDLIDPLWIVDHRAEEKHLYTPEPRIFEIEQSRLRVVENPPVYSGIRIESWGIDPIMPKVEVSGFDYDPDDQPFHLEVWVEKSTANDILIPICQRFGANLVVGKGYQSISNTIELLHRIKKPTRILYVADFDRQGKAMPVAIARTIEFYRSRHAPEIDIALDRALLTEDQISRFNLPTAPDSDDVELDALIELHPGAIEEVISDRLRRYTDPGLEHRLSQARQKVEDQISGWDSEAAERGATELSQRISDLIDRHQTELEEEIAPILDDLRAWLHATTSDLRAFLAATTVEVPPRPEPEPTADDSGMLFDSRRSDLDQLKAYRAAQRGNRR